MRDDQLTDVLDTGNVGAGEAPALDHVGPRSSRRRRRSRSQYAAYIESVDWRLSPARLAELLASGGRCRLCDAGPESRAIHVHHRCYDRLGCERPDDLTALCDECHGFVTAMLRRRENAKRTLPAAVDVDDRPAGRTLIDSRPVRA